MTRGELLDRMDSQELSAWHAFMAFEPFGEQRADLRAAQLTSLTANVNRDPEKMPTPFRPMDFMIHLDDEEREAWTAHAEREAMLTGFEAMGAPPEMLAELRAQE